MSNVLIAGTLAIDYIKTPQAEFPNLLGGSASYAALSASHFGPVDVVGVIGNDFPEQHRAMLESRQVRFSGVEVRQDTGSLNWGGEYRDAMNECFTLWTRLNALEDWTAKVPEVLTGHSIVVLANMHPINQAQVLDQMENPGLVLLDTMNFWLASAREELEKVVPRADILVLNHAEAQDYAGSDNLIVTAERLLEKGVRYVIIKLGEFGALLAGRDEAGELQLFRAPAWPLRDVTDPTGAGDSFLGALAGKLAQSGCRGIPDFRLLREAVAHASAAASFTCQTFSTMGLESATAETLSQRVEDLRQIAAF